MIDAKLINDNTVLIGMDEYVRLIAVDRNFDALTEAGVEKWAYNVSAYHDAPPTPSEQSVREELTAEDAVLLPRVWVGPSTVCAHWKWESGSWSYTHESLEQWTIFIAGLGDFTPEYEELDALATCYKVDWR